MKTAQEAIANYHDDAAINGLDFDRHEEGVAVETFTRGIELASKAFLKDPLSSGGFGSKVDFHLIYMN